MDDGVDGPLALDGTNTSRSTEVASLEATTCQLIRSRKPRAFRARCMVAVTGESYTAARQGYMYLQIYSCNKMVLKMVASP